MMVLKVIRNKVKLVDKTIKMYKGKKFFQKNKLSVSLFHTHTHTHTQRQRERQRQRQREKERRRLFIESKSFLLSLDFNRGW